MLIEFLLLAGAGGGECMHTTSVSSVATHGKHTERLGSLTPLTLYLCSCRYIVLVVLYETSHMIS
jgi:hypothetical protein